MTSKNIIEYFRKMPDPREDNRRHLLIDTIVIVICASICGAEKWDVIEAFGKAKESWFRRFLALPHGIPSHDTIAKVFSKLSLEHLNERFHSWASTIKPQSEQEIVNIAGKTLRLTSDRSNGKSTRNRLSLEGEQGTRTISDELKQKTRYFISSLDAGAQRIGEIARAQWAIKNSRHWVLGVAFREDECRKRKDSSAEKFAILRHITLNLLKQKKRITGASLKNACWQAGIIATWRKSYSIPKCVCPDYKLYWCGKILFCD